MKSRKSTKIAKIPMILRNYNDHDCLIDTEENTGL